MFIIYDNHRVTSPGVTSGGIASTQVQFHGDALIFMLRVSLRDVDELLEPEMKQLTDVNDVLKICLDEEYKIHELQLMTQPHINKSKRSKMNIVSQIREAQQPCGVESEKTYVIVIDNDDSFIISRASTPRQYLCKETLLYEFDEESLFDEDEWNGTKSI